jgi:hypothetical protein
MPKQREIQQTDNDICDVVIVGAGIAGFYVGTELLRKHKGLRVILTDKYRDLGGRTFTFEADISGVHYQWEEGAARIRRDHEILLGLAKRHGLKLVPIGGDLQFQVAGRPAEPDQFVPGIPALLDPLRALPKSALQNSTIREILERTHGGPAAVEEFLVRYPYRAEFEILRADLALDLFIGSGEFSSFSGYCYLEAGFSELIRRMEKEFLSRGGRILRQHEFVAADLTGAKFLVGAPSEGPSRPEAYIRSHAVVLAIPSAALGRIPQFSDLPFLKHLRMEPLLRVYAAWNPAKWKGGIPKVVTPSPNRFIIPGGKGIIQISYTDSRDAEPLIALLKEKGERALGEFLVKELAAVLGHPVPPPLFVRAHKWKEAVTYWLPGDYSPQEMSKAACNPLPETLPNLYLCGESYSLRQCWVEGALEHAQQMLGSLLPVIS